ncbi:hypothetical protein T01_522 [Trichinella spiralis]|uniref:Uncharacterized protein n=1 Tax=Trichinella spiralis TaxID=6334 RepID=A0A0V1BB17_TRISP|nr:hypothetical protein T01_522 [Trichinella spiralis]
MSEMLVVIHTLCIPILFLLAVDWYGQIAGEQMSLLSSSSISSLLDVIVI